MRRWCLAPPATTPGLGKLSDLSRNVPGMVALSFEAPADVVLRAVDDASLDLRDWDGRGMPAAVVLRWVEDAEPGAWLLGLLDEIDPLELPAEDRPRLLAALDRAQAHLAARKARVIASLPSVPTSTHDERSIDTAPYEVSVALRVPLGAAQTEVFRARRLRSHLTGTYAALDRGDLTARHAAAMVAATASLEQRQCAEVEARVLPGAADQSVGEFTRRVRRAVAAIDPQSFAERHRAAAATSDVICEPDDDAMAWLTARMPLVDALVVKAAVDAYAAGRKADADQRPVGVIRAEALRAFAELYLARHKPTAHGRPVEVQVAVTPEALLGLDECPGEVPGVGPVPAETIRELLGEARLRCLTVDGDSGALLDYGRRTYRVPTALAAHVVTRDVASVGPHSTVPARRCDLDHLQPFPGPTSVDNLAPMDRRWHRAKTHAAFTVRRRGDGTLEWTTPLGQRARVRPHDYRLGP